MPRRRPSITGTLPAVQLIVTEFGRLRLPPMAAARAATTKWRRSKPWAPDRRFKTAAPWLRYEKRVREFSLAEYMAGRDPTHAPEWDAKRDG